MDEYTRMVYDCKEKLVVTVLEKCGYSREEATSIYEGAIEFEKLFSQYCYTLDDFNRVETTDTINKQIFSAQELEKFGNFSIVSDITKREGYPETVHLNMADGLIFSQLRPCAAL